MQKKRPNPKRRARPETEKILLLHAKISISILPQTRKKGKRERKKQMDEIMEKPEAGLTPLAMLAEEARVYSENIVMNTLNLGRVLTEAKRQVKHGEWGDWVAVHAGMSVRSAQTFMQAYSRFGGKPAFALVDKSKLYKMLALPEGTEEAFMESHDVAAMSSREVEEAVKQEREKARAEREQAVSEAREEARAEREEALRQAAKQAEAELKASVKRAYEETKEEHENDLKRAVDAARALESEKKAHKETMQQRQEAERARADAEKAWADADAARQAAEREAERIRQELDENNELLDEMQAECSKAQEELLNLQSQIAKGDAQRLPDDELTSEIFASAVRQFIGTCARMPHMGNTFAEMPTETHRRYAELLETIEAWARDARRALDTTNAEAEVR